MDKTITIKKSSTTTQKNETNANNKPITNKPSQQVIDNILNFSKALSIIPSSTVEFVEVVLN